MSDEQAATVQVLKTLAPLDGMKRENLSALAKKVSVKTLGGGRALYRMARGKPASSVFDEEFVSLDLTGELLNSRAAVERSHPKG